MTDPRLLAPQELCRRCDASQFPFATTAELEDGIDIIGQERALDAARFAIDIKRPGFNLFVLGEPGSGRHASIGRLLAAKAASEAVPDDWCYVNNFAEPERPLLLRLPAGMGQRLRQDMQQFVAELGPAITATFESDEFHSRVEAIQEEFKEREEGALHELGGAAKERGIALLRTPQGFVFAPIKDDATMSGEEFEKLADEEKRRLSAATEEFGERLHKLMHQFPRWRREMQVKIRAASREAMGFAVGHLIEELKERYQQRPNVLEFLDAALRDIVEKGEDIHEQSRGDGEEELTGSVSLRRYQVNLLVDHAASTAAPVVFEDNPTYPNLVGRVDQIAQMGMLVTNFTMVRAGALHRANGGYLMLDALKVLMQPYGWEGLKRALKSRQVRIESLSQIYGLVSTQSIEPEPVPLDAKVVLVGDRETYYLLRELDPEFEELFKVAADFEDEVERDGGNSELYARLVATVAKRDGLRPFAAGAVARVVEHAARLAEDAEKLSACTRRIADLLHEAEHRAVAAGREAVAREDVDAALAARRERTGRLRRGVHEYIERGIQLIDTAGERVGQVNGLAVIDPGSDEMFGHPVRLTATVRMGEGEIVDIEREAELGGAIHSKGVLILSSFLAARFARNLPLSLGASLVFEQSYGPVEGDSASLAELCALLSALAEAPIRQSIAVTGSVNQHGRVQAIGGVNEKIEGFFEVCRQRGLTGEQGAIIPESNVAHLMLNDEVVAACAAGRFRIWAVDHVDAAIELLTGVPAGQPDAMGIIPPGSMNYRVAVRLAEMSELRQEYGAGPRKKRRKRGEEAG
ncbi:MAG: Lon protease family protein [Ignavibacteria bacterium]